MSKVHIVQSCKNECGMKVETMLNPGDAVPEPRACVACKAAK